VLQPETCGSFLNTGNPVKSGNRALVIFRIFAVFKKFAV